MIKGKPDDIIKGKAMHAAGGERKALWKKKQLTKREKTG